MKKRFLAVLLLITIILIPRVVKAEFEDGTYDSYAVGEDGNYIVKNAYCIYDSSEGQIKITLKDNQIQSVGYTNGKGEIKAGTIAEVSHTFFENKFFVCRKTLYKSYDAYMVSIVNQGSNGSDANELKLTLASSYNGGYYKKTEKDSSTNTYSILCQYNKMESDTSARAEAPNIVKWVKYKTGVNAVIANGKTYNVTSGSIDCNNLNVAMKFSNNSVSIVGTGCSGVDGKCVLYGRNDYTNRGRDDGANMDGSNKELAEGERVDPTTLVHDVTEAHDCTSLLGEPGTPETPAWYLAFAFNVIKYVAIVLLIVLSTMDMISAVTSHDNDEIKKMTAKIIKRLILCVVIFLLPELIKFLLSFLHENTGTCI